MTEKLIRALKGELSLTLVLPEEFANRLGVRKGDLLKCMVEGNKLTVEKVDT